MSLYNMLFGVNNKAGMLLECLGFKPSNIPRFRDCFIQDNSICVHTRTGGGNRDFYESEEICRQNYPEHFSDTDEPPSGPWNSELKSHPNYVTDYDDDLDCTYANFIFSFPEEYKQDLEALAKDSQDYKPSEKWQLLFKSMEK